MEVEETGLQMIGGWEQLSRHGVVGAGPDPGGRTIYAGERRNQQRKGPGGTTPG